MSVVIVTGGTFGIGQAISVVLAERGHGVVAFGLDTPQPGSIAAGGTTILRELAAARGLGIDAREADVAKQSDVQGIVDFTLAKFGRIDALVNNAGIAPLGTVLDTPEELWDRVIDVNVKGMFLCCKAVVPHLIAAGGGSIVNIGSGAGWGKPNMTAYSTSKGAIFAFSAALAYDFFHHRIRVNTICPGGGGYITGQSMLRAQSGQVPTPRGTAAGRPPTGEDVAHAVAFLLSPDATVISGTILDVGGFAHEGGPIPPKPEGVPA
jgi:NAD(P)-dependent dehydrogenase (short-subunit alcohol dehydrogenase family)